MALQIVQGPSRLDNNFHLHLAIERDKSRRRKKVFLICGGTIPTLIPSLHLVPRFSAALNSIFYSSSRFQAFMRPFDSTSDE